MQRLVDSELAALVRAFAAVAISGIGDEESWPWKANSPVP